VVEAAGVESPVGSLCQQLPRIRLAQSSQNDSNRWIEVQNRYSSTVDRIARKRRSEVLAVRRIDALSKMHRGPAVYAGRRFAANSMNGIRLPSDEMRFAKCVDRSVRGRSQKMSVHDSAVSIESAAVHWINWKREQIRRRRRDAASQTHRVGDRLCCTRGRHPAGVRHSANDRPAARDQDARIESTNDRSRGPFARASLGQPRKSTGRGSTTRSSHCGRGAWTIRRSLTKNRRCRARLVKYQRIRIRACRRRSSIASNMSTAANSSIRSPRSVQARAGTSSTGSPRIVRTPYPTSLRGARRPWAKIRAHADRATSQTQWSA
jgi:hypothetical protein